MGAFDSVARGLSARIQRDARRRHRFNGISIISNTNSTPNAGSGTVATGGTIAATARIRHQNLTGRQIIAAAPLYAHYGPAASTEAATANQIQVKAALEFDGTASDETGGIIGCFFNGTYLATIERRGWAVPQLAPCNKAPLDYIFERTGITAPANSNTYSRSQNALGGTSAVGIDNGDGLDASDKVLSGTSTDSALASYTAVGMLGRTLDGTIAPSLAVIGDSIAVGTDDGSMGANHGGWPQRAFASYPMICLAIAGEKLSQAVLATNFQCRYALSAFATHVLDAYGRNDIQVPDSLATLKANVLLMAARFMKRGQNYIKATVLPAPTSSDVFLLVSNQTKETNDARRVEFNQWIRDPSADGFVAQANAQVASIPFAGIAMYCDPCALIECDSSGVLTEDGGYIIAPTQNYTNGTASAGSTTSVTDSGKSWTVNEHKGRSLHILSGTGSGQVRTVAYNSATVLSVVSAFSPAPDNTSTYRVTDSPGMNGVHPTGPGHVLAGEAIDADALMMAGN